MVELVNRKKKNIVSSIVPLNKKNEFDETEPISTEKDYKKLMGDKIKEKQLALEIDGKEIKGGSKEHIQKKRKWMHEVIKPILDIKDILENTELFEVKLINRRGNAALNDLKNVIIKTKKYDDSKIIKSGFKLVIDFCPRSQILNNKRDCYLVQLLGDTMEHESVTKYYNVDALMEFIINYCSDYITEACNKK